MKVYAIAGVPIPLQRHRHHGKFSYDPQKKQKINFAEKLWTTYFDVKPVENAINLTIEYHMPIPKSYSKKRHTEVLEKPHSGRPDLSNLIKFTEDALNGILWKDDALIASIKAKKFYSLCPQTVIKIKNVASKVFD